MKDTLVVFTYALAGFGHLRVTDALYEGTPLGVDSEILESNDEKVKNFHRLTTGNYTIRQIFEWGQDGPLSHIFTDIYKSTLSSNVDMTFSEVAALLKKQIRIPKKVVFVCTHFGLAYEIIAVRDRLETELGIKTYIVVQVTDDYCHPMWYVEGADLTLVPSQLTKERFIELGKLFNYNPINIEVLPYPVSKFFQISLTPGEMAERMKFENVSVPLSGSAANLDYYKELLSHLLTVDRNLKFFITTRKASYTNNFINTFSGNPNVNILSSESDSEVVHFYDQVLTDNVISLEITKPSELSFKTLIEPTMRGGVAMLFTQPFGSQEKSNLEFLQRHNLIPTWDEAERLWQMNSEDKEMIDKACGWRGLPLPPEPRHAARFIPWCRENKIFSQMVLCKNNLSQTQNKEEVSPFGVERFWETIQRLSA